MVIINNDNDNTHGDKKNRKSFLIIKKIMIINDKEKNKEYQ